MHHSYLSLPIKFEYEIINNVIPFINIEPGIQVNSNFEHTDSKGLDEKRTITNEMETFNLFTGAGVKYRFDINEQNFSISGQINFGLLRITKKGQFGSNNSYGWADWRSREVLLNLEYYFCI